MDTRRRRRRRNKRLLSIIELICLVVLIIVVIALLHHQGKNHSSAQTQGAGKNTTAQADVTSLGTSTLKADYQADSKTVKLTWKKVSNATDYIVYRKEEGAKTSQKLAETAKTAYTDKSTAQDKKYDYTVQAVYKKDDKTTVRGKNSKVATADTFYINPKGKMVALTFDDGPGEYTDELVDTLKKYHAHATFFVVGENIAKYHKEMQYAAAEGNEIGNHSWSHPQLSRLSDAGIRSQLNRTDRLIKKYTGKKATLTRPPYGAINARVRKICQTPIVLWSLDTLDWKTLSTPSTVHTVMAEASDGSVILMHDIHKPTVKAAEQLIPKLQKKGYQLVTVSEMAKYKGLTLKKGIAYGNIAHYKKMEEKAQKAKKNKS